MLVNLLENRGKEDERCQSGTANMCYVPKGRAEAVKKSVRLGHTRPGVTGVCRSEQIINLDSQNGKQAKADKIPSFTPP